MAKILIVEDEQALNDAYRMILEQQGHTISTAFNGQEALDAVQKAQPDLILLDLRMPKMNGIEFLQAFAGIKSDTKVIIFSNLDDQAEIDKAYGLGADRYIIKAWASPNELVKVVRDSLTPEQHEATT